MLATWQVLNPIFGLACLMAASWRSLNVGLLVLGLVLAAGRGHPPLQHLLCAGNLCGRV